MDQVVLFEGFVGIVAAACRCINNIYDKAAAYSTGKAVPSERCDNAVTGRLGVSRRVPIALGDCGVYAFGGLPAVKSAPTATRHAGDACIDGGTTPCVRPG